ncbi:MAG TPA: hypothetical protein PLM53_17190 [Spirochaetota bacterium]|nr:hypothetical protein [Spirochaetota bacterium]HPC42994.1 hypothetical protein [Spirochaetota bacterium]HQF10093.1 hypothetical protein [Spirochaetota bacterium]HQH98833.1 hypothetical protein [Spirochaetota bacterium]HQJ70485.1 hypothetical protein [Spirochaetota bacterium]
MNSHAFRTIVIGMMAALSLLVSACDELNTGLVKRGYSFLVNFHLRWTHPENLGADMVDFNESGISGAADPRVAMDGHGNAVIVWRQKPDGETYHIYKSEFRNNAWINPADKDDHLNYSGDLYGDVKKPAVAMSNDGTAIVSWLQEYRDEVMMPFEQSAWVYQYGNGIWNFLSPNPRVSYNLSEHLSVDMNDLGVAEVITTMYYSATIYQVWVSEITNGINNYNKPLSSGATDSTNPDVAVNNSGSVLVAWEQDSRIYMNMKTGSVWSGDETGTPIGLTGAEVYTAIKPKVAISDNGTAVIVWTQQFNTVGFPTHVYRSYYNGTSWSHPAAMIDSVDPMDPGDPHLYWADSADVAMDGSGNAIMVWRMQRPDGEVHLQMSQCSNGVWSVIPYSEVASHFDPDGGVANEPDVAMDSSSNAVIVWDQYDGAAYNHIYKSEYRNGRWTHPASLDDNIDSESPAERSGFTPQVATNPGGETIIVWDQFLDMSNRHIYKSECRPYREILPLLY